ncbi:MAG: YfdQ family protein [Candidatus Thiodiazotropha lotti]|nr:YfdQ family protein [Candidatus Thiodiazotropha lotti]MCW4188295.1 YfdQ family protein [Candidatus Thiodiazotropha lotti]
MDNTAIKEINNNSSVKEVNNRFQDIGFVAIPNDHTIQDTNRLDGLKRYFKATYTTDSLLSFIKYVNENKVESAELFVDRSTMEASAIFDMYDEEYRPAMCAHQAMFAAQKTPEYKAILQLVSLSPVSQRKLAEFGEEWGDVFAFIDSNDEPIELIKAINAIRNMKVKSSSSSESKVGDMSASRSRTADIEAKGQDVTVAGLIGDNTNIYLDLEPRNIKIKFSIHTNGDDIALSARLLNKDRLLESLAQELCETIDKQAEITTYIGTIKV